MTIKLECSDRCRHHHATDARHCGHLVQHLGDRSVRADKHALVGRQMVDSQRFAAVRLRVR